MIIVRNLSYLSYIGFEIVVIIILIPGYREGFAYFLREIYSSKTCIESLYKCSEILL